MGLELATLQDKLKDLQLKDRDEFKDQIKKLRDDILLQEKEKLELNEFCKKTFQNKINIEQ
jgi:hypothetical protein